MKTKFTFIIFILASFSLYSQPVLLGSLEGNETYFTGFNGKVYFASGTEIKVADTLSKSIRLLADLQEPVISDKDYSRSFDVNLRAGYGTRDAPRFPVAGDFIYPLTKPYQDSVSMWKIDKSETIVEKIGVFDSIYAYTAFKNDLYFAASKAGYGFQIWKAGQSGTISKLTNWDSAYSFYLEFVPGDDFLYFTHRSPCVGSEECTEYSSLYKSDGTAEGTINVSDFEAPGKGWIGNLTFFKNKLYFIYADTIWTYDNENIIPFLTDNGYYDEYNFSRILKVNNYLIYEIMHEMAPDNRLYSKEGGTGESVFLSDQYDFNNYFPVGEQLFFYSMADYYIGSFHKTDGTPGGTDEFIPLIGEYEVANRFQAVKEYLFYDVWEGYKDSYEVNYELYQTDLTAAGSQKVQDIFGGSQSYDMANNFAEANGILFFTTGEKNTDIRAEPTQLYYYNPVSPVITAVKKSAAPLVAIYPNPAGNTCFLKADVQGTISLTDALGKTVLEDDFNQERMLDLSNLASGVYFARLLTNENKVIVEKIVKR